MKFEIGQMVRCIGITDLDTPDGTEATTYFFSLASGKIIGSNDSDGITGTLGIIIERASVDELWCGQNMDFIWNSYIWYSQETQISYMLYEMELEAI